MPEWLKGADCKSAGFGLRRFESFSLHQNAWIAWLAGVAQLARVSAFQAEGCGFETRLPLHSTRPCGSVVEHTLGKGEVAGSILAMGSKLCGRE